MSLTTSSTVKTVADSDGWKLVGALTTTFTPPAGCNKIISTEDNSLAILGTGYFDRGSCYPSSQSTPIRVYYRPGLACPSGWISELLSGIRANPNLPSLRPGETAVVCCPGGLRYTETVLRLAPGVGGWCLGTLSAPTSIEPIRCANCDGTPTPLPITNSDKVAMTLIEYTLLLRQETAAGINGSSASSSASSSAPSISAPPSNGSGEEPSSGLSSAAKTGIAMGIVIAVILLAFAFWAFFIKRLRERRQMQAPQSLNEVKEADGTSVTITELIGDTNPHMRTHEIGRGTEVLSVAPVVYMEPVELATTPFNRYSRSRLPNYGGGEMRGL
ncbi:hypothetical protein B0T25DRAFT_633491 [Lasiosphaeria hispida]|uniref:WSC domain-containing protein n=1 Tax=Lasiosphaeria hispida TaxID=260671 RepID=A0AAJ0HA22_9PEZI|nr:hypothetical protein B0T25DRAFT_633491 [Lasiosphaeria hispida]